MLIMKHVKEECQIESLQVDEVVTGLSSVLD